MKSQAFRELPALMELVRQEIDKGLPRQAFVTHIKEGMARVRIGDGEPTYQWYPLITTGAQVGSQVAMIPLPDGAFLLLPVDPGAENQSLALGYGSVAEGVQSAAMGFHATASGEQSLAVGRRAAATANSATAVGDTASASGANSVAVGADATAGATASTAIGKSALASEIVSLAAGFEAKATGQGSTALGVQAEARPGGSLAVGYKAKAEGVGSSAIGTVAQTAPGDSGVVEIAGKRLRLVRRVDEPGSPILPSATDILLLDSSGNPNTIGVSSGGITFNGATIGTTYSVVSEANPVGESNAGVGTYATGTVLRTGTLSSLIPEITTGIWDVDIEAHALVYRSVATGGVYLYTGWGGAQRNAALGRLFPQSSGYTLKVNSSLKAATPGQVIDMRYTGFSTAGTTYVVNHGWKITARRVG